MSDEILVAGIGNIFLGDDGFGVEVAQRMMRRALPSRVHVEDFGIRGFDLACALMEPWKLVILVDSVPGDYPPGTLRIIEPAIPQQSEAAEFDGHSLDPASVLQLARQFEGEPAPVVVVGCQPATVDPDESGDLRLSAPVDAAVNEAVLMIEELIAKQAGGKAA